MSPSSVAGIITAVASGLTALGVVITALTIFLPMLRQVRSTHVIVNQQHTDMVNYQAALVRALAAAGVDIPIDQSLATPAPVVEPRKGGTP